MSNQPFYASGGGYPTYNQKENYVSILPGFGKAVMSSLMGLLGPELIESWTPMETRRARGASDLEAYATRVLGMPGGAPQLARERPEYWKQANHVLERITDTLGTGTTPIYPKIGEVERPGTDLEYQQYSEGKKKGGELPIIPREKYTVQVPKYFDESRAFASRKEELEDRLKALGVDPTKDLPARLETIRTLTGFDKYVGTPEERSLHAKRQAETILGPGSDPRDIKAYTKHILEGKEGQPFTPVATQESFDRIRQSYQKLKGKGGTFFSYIFNHLPTEKLRDVVYHFGEEIKLASHEEEKELQRQFTNSNKSEHDFEVAYRGYADRIARLNQHHQLEYDKFRKEWSTKNPDKLPPESYEWIGGNDIRRQLKTAEDKLEELNSRRMEGFGNKFLRPSKTPDKVPGYTVKTGGLGAENPLFQTLPMTQSGGK